MPSEPQPIKGFLRNTHFARLLKTAREQAELVDTVKGLLPPPLDAHCLAAARNGDALTLFADSSAWASRIRYLSRNIKQKLRNEGILIKEIRIRVLLENRGSPSVRPAPAGGRLPPGTAALLESLAQGMVDPEQRAILLRISKNARRDP